MTSPQANPAQTVPLVGTMIYGLIRAQAVCVAARLGIADLLIDGPQSAASLAKAVHGEADAVRRLLNYLAGEGVFTRDADDQYALNDAAEALRSDNPQSVRPMALSYGSPLIWSAWGSLLEAVTGGGSGFEAAHGEPLFPYLAGHPDDATVFNNFMTSLAARRPRLSSLDFAGVSTVVDVGGGHGATIIDILQHHANVRGVLFDTPAVAEGAKGVIASAGLDDRCTVVGGSFFEAVPPDGDAYILSNILHDWNDADCGRILRACRAPMRPGARLIVAELIVPEESVPSLARTIDLQMLVVTGGVQRTLREFQTLFDTTGFGQARVLPSTFIEVAAV
jgi:hypothetical protein